MIGILVGLATGAMWTPKGIADDPDSFVAFRGHFQATTSQVSLKILGASEYLVWIDGKLFHDGPARYAKAFPEYQTQQVAVAPGEHTLAVQVRNNRVTTRILSDIPGFLWCGIDEGGKEIPIEWKCSRLPGYRPRAHRISDILGWIDWCDTRQLWSNWTDPSFDDKSWKTPVPVDPGIGEIKPCGTKPVSLKSIALKPMAKGAMAANLGYENDEPAARFFLDDLNPKGIPPQGVWRRYDLGRIRLGRPKISLNAPAGTIVEFAMSEQLQHGRVHPWITLSGSTTCNMDHFVARGGTQEFMPFTPKGGRYLEVHVRSEGKVDFVNEAFLERTSYPDVRGSFTCSDPLLNKIWQVGVNTVQACADDALVDCPTRERGEWTGDVASVATDIAAVAFGDLSLSRRALVQAAQVARSDGMVAGVGPGDPGYLSTYAAQWTTACYHYYELTGDRRLLEELYPAAVKNMAAFKAHWHKEGLDGNLGWGFVDWGYVGNEGPSDMALNLHYYKALESMALWESLVSPSHELLRQLAEVKGVITSWLRIQSAKPGGWKNVGYHRGALALKFGLVEKSEVPKCVAMMKQHILSCFPNNSNGPRLSDPGVANPNLITPYFGHWALSALMENGEADFVLDQYRKCWGWALGVENGTWIEVFDPRWSHCHEWSGCPTWQLSEYVLGIRKWFHLGKALFTFQPVKTKLSNASGVVAFGTDGKLRVSWTRKNGKIHARLEANRPVLVKVWGGQLEVTKPTTLVIPASR